jgi:hypothetical protein
VIEMSFPVAAMSRGIFRDIGDLGYIVFRPPLAINKYAPVVVHAAISS